MKQLKSELGALDRKITAALSPKKEEQGDVKRDEPPKHSVKSIELQSIFSRCISSLFFEEADEVLGVLKAKQFCNLFCA